VKKVPVAQNSRTPTNIQKQKTERVGSEEKCVRLIVMLVPRPLLPISDRKMASGLPSMAFTCENFALPENDRFTGLESDFGYNNLKSWKHESSFSEQPKIANTSKVEHRRKRRKWGPPANAAANHTSGVFAQCIHTQAAIIAQQSVRLAEAQATIDALRAENTVLTEKNTVVAQENTVLIQENSVLARENTAKGKIMRNMSVALNKHC
jgi:cell division protein FtsB